MKETIFHYLNGSCFIGMSCECSSIYLLYVGYIIPFKGTKKLQLFAGRSIVSDTWELTESSDEGEGITPITTTYAEKSRVCAFRYLIPSLSEMRNVQGKLRLIIPFVLEWIEKSILLRDCTLIV